MCMLKIIFCLSFAVNDELVAFEYANPEKKERSLQLKQTVNLQVESYTVVGDRHVLIDFKLLTEQYVELVAYFAAFIQSYSHDTSPITDLAI